MKSIPIENDDNLETLSNKLSILGRDLLLDTLPSIIDGSNDNIPQDEEKVVYAYNIKPEEEEIDFNNRSIDIYNLIGDRNILKKVVLSMLIKYKTILKYKLENIELKENDEIFKNNDIITLSKKVLVINEMINLLDSNLNKNLAIDRLIIEMWRCEE